MLTDPNSFVTSPATQQPILCDDYAGAGPDVSCTVQIFDRRSPHYRDLLDGSYLTGMGFDAPFAIADIVAAGETRWVFQ